jgi:hypothetical protein
MKAKKFSTSICCGLLLVHVTLRSTASKTCNRRKAQCNSFVTSSHCTNNSKFLLNVLLHQYSSQHFIRVIKSIVTEEAWTHKELQRRRRRRRKITRRRILNQWRSSTHTESEKKMLQSNNKVDWLQTTATVSLVLCNEWSVVDNNVQPLVPVD